MRYLTVATYGTFLGISDQCLVIKHEGEIIKEVALSRLRCISVLKSGVSMSSDLVQACAIRGIKIFFCDWRGRVTSAVIGQNQHATVAVRKAQFKSIDSESCCFNIARSIILTKIRNQRAVLMYFSKYQSKVSLSSYTDLLLAVKKIDDLIVQLKNLNVQENWRNLVLGIEGACARFYWNALRQASLLPADFKNREGRGATTITNQALNWSYAILESYVWSALENAGLEVFAGFFHSDRPGKPSLVLDVKEEYRAWVVDRNIVKFRDRLVNSTELNSKLKVMLTDAVHDTMHTAYSYHRKKVKLENILQRQVYRLSGVILENKTYKGYVFKW